MLSEGDKIENNKVHDHIHAAVTNAFNGTLGNEHSATVCAAADPASKGIYGNDEHGKSSSTKDVGWLSEKRLKRSTDRLH
jgi:hypothetical protein